MKFAFKTSETSTNIIHLQLQSSESTDIMIGIKNIENMRLVYLESAYLNIVYEGLRSDTYLESSGYI
jgi:hypothetical protein